jgi:alkylation response protein AidB-like acyl-CoA dehydrogenase
MAEKKRSHGERLAGIEDKLDSYIQWQRERALEDDSRHWKLEGRVGILEHWRTAVVGGFTALVAWVKYGGGKF